MNFMKDLQESLQRGSFEINDQSLNDFPFMDGYLQPTNDEKIMVYQWDEVTNQNKRVWVSREEL